MAISVDFETFFSKKLKYSLRSMISETYVKHELFHPYFLSVCDGKNQWAGEPKNFNWAALEGKTLLSHNQYFDGSVYDEMVIRGWVPKIAYKEWHCTANMTAYLCNRRALDNAVEFLFGVKLAKDVRESADNRHWPNDFSEAEQAAMHQYAGKDAYWCWRLWDTFSDKWPELERRLSKMTIDQGRRGVQLDREKLDTYIIQSHEMKLATEATLPWMEDDNDSWEEFETSPTSTKCIAEQCRRMGIPCPPIKAHEGEEAYEEWEATYSKQHPWIPGLSSWRSVNKLYKSFLLMKRRMRSDGTMPFALKYFGAHTGRWSGSERINMQNPRKKAIICVKDTGMMETKEPRIDEAIKAKKKTGVYPDWVKYGLDMRSLFIPRPGTKMITCDLSQIEPRVLAWLCNNKALLALISGGMSVYEAFARTQLGYDTPGKMDKDSDYYKMVKIQVLGLGYQAGWEKFITICAENPGGGIDITKDDPEWIETIDPHTEEVKRVSGYGKRSKEIVAEFRAKNPKLTSTQEPFGLWEKLDQAFKRSIGSDFNMSLPSGRKMSYRSVKCVVRIEANAEGKPVRKWEYSAESDGRRKAFYGGKLTENLVQATAREVFAEHLIALEDDPRIKVLFTSHDEAICECAPDVGPEDVEKVMSRCPEWLPGCPIAAEAKEVAHYTK
jgi:hypothetical protein